MDGRLLVELKACRATADEHVAQILGYLKSAKIEDGLLINFGSYKFEIKKYMMNRASGQVSTNKPGAFPAFFFALLAFFCGKSS